MTARFRIRTAQGQELSFASREAFEEFVRSGDLAPDDLVYDGDTGEWAPSRTHPVVLEIQYADEEEAQAVESGRGKTKAVDSAKKTKEPEEEIDPNLGHVTDLDSMGSFGLELAPPAEGLSPEEEAAAFVRKMESERAMERDFGSTPSGSPMQDLRSEAGSHYADMVRQEPEPEPEPPPPPRPRPRTEPKKRPRPSREPRATIDRRVPAQKKTGRKQQGKSRQKGKKSGGLLGKLFWLVLLAALAGAAVYFGTDLLGREAAPSDDAADSLVVLPDRPPVQDPDPAPTPAPTIAGTESAVRERARERFVSSTQGLIDALQPIPDDWLTGDYFVLPSEYPQIRAVWERYRTAIRDLRAGDRDRYRRAYIAALDDAGIASDSPERDGRVAAAVSAFADTEAEVVAHWDRVDGLALAAIQSHDALLGGEGLILYDPSGSTGRPEGIARGTSGRNSDAQLLLDQVVELLGNALAADGFGPREGASVREWVWGGFLDATTR